MSVFEDLSGKKFNRWTVLNRVENSKGNSARWLCQCDCGTIKVLRASSVKNGGTKSCGCYHKELMSGKKMHDLTGQVFDRLTVLSRASNAPSGGVRWHCRCECGEETIVLANNLARGHTRSCGCLFPEKVNVGNRTHGLSNTKAYGHWVNMRNRCSYPSDPQYQNYGGRGIKVCPGWLHSFEDFYKDMGDPYEGMTIDRIDVNGDYTPENCKWASRKEQARNRRNNHQITLRGETRCQSEWADVLQIPIDSIRWFCRNYGDEEGIRRCLAKHGKAA